MRLRTRFEWAADAWTAMRAKLSRSLNPYVGEVLATFVEMGLGWVGEGIDRQIFLAIKRIRKPEGQDLIDLFDDYPIEPPRSATSARCPVMFVLSADATLPVTVPAGTKTRAGTSGPIYAADAAAELYSSGLIPSTSAVAGSSSRVVAGEVDTLVDVIAGVSRVFNPSDSTGGTDGESDAELTSRLSAWWDTLTKGTPAAYERYALSVPGVISAGCREDWPSPGEVTVCVCDGQGSADDTMLAAVETAIESGGNAHSPGCRAAGIRAWVMQPERLLFIPSLWVHMTTGKVADSAADIRSAVIAAMARYGIGSRVALSAVGRSVEGAVDTVGAVTGISAESVQMPRLLPIRVLSVGGKSWSSSRWDWNYSTGMFRWGGGAWIDARSITTAPVEVYNSDSSAWMTCGVDPFVEGSRWPAYSTSETVTRGAMSDLTYLEKSQILVCGEPAIYPAPIGTMISGVSA